MRQSTVKSFFRCPLLNKDKLPLGAKSSTKEVDRQTEKDIQGERESERKEKNMIYHCHCETNSRQWTPRNRNRKNDCE